MAFLTSSEIMQGGQSCLPNFVYLFILLFRVPEPKLVIYIFTSHIGSKSPFLAPSLFWWLSVWHRVKNFWSSFAKTLVLYDSGLEWRNHYFSSHFYSWLEMYRPFFGLIAWVCGSKIIISWQNDEKTRHLAPSYRFLRF